MSVVCGTTTCAVDSKISNQPVTFESNQIAIVRFEFESNLEASQSLEKLVILFIEGLVDVDFEAALWLRGSQKWSVFVVVVYAKSS